MAAARNPLLAHLERISDDGIVARARNARAFRSAMAATTRELRSTVVDILSGGELTTRKAVQARTIVQLQSALAAQLNRAGYDDAVRELMAAYPGSIQRALRMLRQMDIRVERLSKLNEAAFEQLRAVDYDFLRDLGQQSVNEVARGLVQNTIMGTSRSVTIERIGRTLDTRLRNHAVTYADTALVTFDRTASLEIWQDAGLEKYEYRGPADIKNRPVCARWVGRVFTIAEINKLDNGAGLPVLRFGGGWNCRHVFIPWVG